MVDIILKRNGYCCYSNSLLVRDATDHGRTSLLDLTKDIKPYGQKTTSFQFLKVVQMILLIFNHYVINVSLGKMLVFNF